MRARTPPSSQDIAKALSFTADPEHREAEAGHREQDPRGGGEVQLASTEARRRRPAGLRVDPPRSSRPRTAAASTTTRRSRTSCRSLTGPGPGPRGLRAEARGDQR
ncbi:hypothetical protein HBB16_16970 [Pseudonocardia sp. MCCB 268]|nr:hypothetical protein [Pseudonocardia cytotoxica]